MKVSYSIVDYAENTSAFSMYQAALQRNIVYSLVSMLW